MASPAYETILAVQDLDLTVARLRHRIETHPARADVAAAGEAVESASATVAGLDSQLHDLGRDIKRLADEVAGIDAKRSDIDRRLYGGTVTASKELLALQDEATSLRNRKDGLEDDELELMEQQEELEAQRATARTEAERAGAELDRTTTELAEATGALEAEIAEVEAERDEMAAGAPADLLATYGELAPRYGGVAVARLVDGHCDGCHMQLSAVARDRITRAPADAVVTCEECGRLLVT